MSILIELLKSLVYGVIQGITEWLPISSTGHLILLNTVMPLNLYPDASANLAFWNMYKVVIQLGSILAVIAAFHSKLWPFDPKRSQARQKQIIRLWLLILIATIPVGIIGFLLNDIIDEKLSTPAVVGVTLLIYGIIFILVEQKPKAPVINSTAEITPKAAVITGLFESLALIPGTSRSGSTIIGSLLLGMNRPTATEFSFYLAIPAMIGASLLKLVKMKITLGLSGILVLLIGMASAYIVSVVVLRSLLRYVRKNSFRLFGAYRIILGLLILILALIGAFPEGIGV